MPTAESDRIFFQAGIQELHDYLLSAELYWPLSAKGHKITLPRLTVGGLLLARLRLRARAVSPAAQAEFDRLDVQLETVRSRWRVAWENKVGREIHARLDLWRNYLDDYRRSPEDHADTYPHEVRWRAMLELLAKEIYTPTSELAALPGLDETLQAHFVSGDFVWEADLNPAFPRDEFWFLYGRLR